MLNNRDFDFEQNNHDYDFCHNQAALTYGAYFTTVMVATIIILNRINLTKVLRLCGIV